MWTQHKIKHNFLCTESLWFPDELDNLQELNHLWHCHISIYLKNLETDTEVGLVQSHSK